MYRDNLPEFQGNDKIRKALNTIIHPTEKKESNEPSFSQCFALKEGYRFMGEIALQGNDHVIFSTNGVSSEIGTVKNCTYTPLINDPCLNFTDRVSGLYRVRKGCGDYIYFTDGVNPVRFLNISRIEEHFTDGSFDCGKTKLTADYGGFVTTVTLSEYGGNVLPGSYHFLFRHTDQEGNATAWNSPTGTVNVYRDSINNPNISADGESTGKAITIDVLPDSSFEYYQVAVVAATSGGGGVTTVKVSAPILATRRNFVFDGFSSSYTDATFEELNIPPLQIDRAETMVDLQGRLVLGNVKDTAYDVCGFQKYASKIKTSWVVNNAILEAKRPGNPQNPIEKGTKIRDEIYARGIVYILDDGSYTRAYHIPGRPKNTHLDNRPLSTVTEDGNADVNFNGDWDGAVITNPGTEIIFAGPGPIERWEAYNTAYVTPSQGVIRGGCGYYETSETYNQFDSPCSEDFWGVDFAGNPLQGTPVRHHRMPDYGLVNNDNGVPGAKHLRLVHDNIELPPGTKGYIIVEGRRGEADKTIIDQGLMVPATSASTSQEDFIGNVHLDNGDPNKPLSNWYTFISPRGLFNKEKVNGSYIKHERAVLFNNGETTDREYDGAGWFVSDVDTRIQTQRLVSTVGPPDRYSDLIGDFVYLGGLEEVEKNGKVVINMSQDNEAYMFRTSTASNRAYIGSIKVYREVYGDLSSIEYVLPQDAYNVPIIYNNTILVDITSGPLQEIVSVIAILAAVAFAALTVGIGAPLAISAAIGITTQVIQAVQEQLRDGRFGNLLWHYPIPNTGPGDHIIYNGQRTDDLRVDCEINTSLAFKNTTQNQFYPVFNNMEDYFRDKIMYFNEDTEKLAVRPVLWPELYLYNPDYSLSPVALSWRGIPASFDCCSDCLGEYPNRVVWSDRSFTEEQIDYYRVFRANNYQDLESDSGDITALFIHREKMYVFTPDASFVLPEDIQERITGSIVSLVGTGDFLSIPPRAITDAKAAGCSDKFSIIEVPGGIFYYERDQGRCFITGIGEITAGVRDDLSTAHRITRQTSQTPYEPVKLNVVAAYDEETETIFLTIEDYELKQFDGAYLPEEVPTGVLYGEGGFFYNNGVSISIGDDEFFNNTSFTLSYYLGTVKGESRWASFHTHVTDGYARGKTRLLNFKGNTAWQHNAEGSWQVFYGQKADHYIDVVHNNEEPATKIFDFIGWQTIGSDSDGRDSDLTFDQVWIRNQNQSTGLLVLEPKTTGFGYTQQQSQDNILLVDRTSRDYYINNFRDRAGENPVESEVPVIRNRLDWTQSKPFEGKYLLTRFIFRNLADIKLITKRIFSPSQKTPQ